jgi:HD-GYP domain-containing protein (c-di-GMP phosphodiesterase class II)
MAGGVVGELTLPDHVLPAALAGLVYVTIRTLLEGLVTRRAALPDLVTSASAVGLGIALAFAAVHEIWLAIVLAPMLFLVEQLYGRVVALRVEMATALETFANIVDERDASTYGHSLRVAGYVNDLADSLGLPRTEVRRLWWAGRLHDLGKVAVDAAVLAKPGKLSPAEWGTVWRAPRLSARLLQRFRFAAQQAQAVEYHRERFNGTGYYRVSQEDIPLAAHFLILADAFDAMTTDKPFRRRMGREEALSEIERESGSQFHPVIAKAFVALQRGQDPIRVLSPEELAGLRDASVPPPSTLPTFGELFRRPEVTALAGGALLLVGLGTTIFPVAVAGLATTLVGLKLWVSRRRRVSRLTAALHETFRHAADHAQMFGGFVDVVDKQDVWQLDYAAFVAWAEDGSGGTVRLERGSHRPPDTAIVSWLVREAESGAGVVVDEGAELASVGFAVALPLRRDNSSLVGFMLLCGKEKPPAHVLPALEACVDALGPAFGEARPADVLRLRKENVKRLDPRRRRERRTLEA